MEAFKQGGDKMGHSYWKKKPFSNEEVGLEDGAVARKKTS